MRSTELIMGMPVTVDLNGPPHLIRQVFEYFHSIDARFSTYRSDSEIAQVNSGLPRSKWSKPMQTIMELCAQTKQETNGYFNIQHNGLQDPSGIVKGWAIWQAAKMLRASKVDNFFIEAGGDIETRGHNHNGQPWMVGIRNPFNTGEVIATLSLSDCGIATSGTYIRGQHIYNPLEPDKPIDDIVSLTVIGPNVYEADRFATAAFAMGRKGIEFIENRSGLEGYLVTIQGVAVFTSGFKNYKVRADKQLGHKAPLV